MHGKRHIVGDRSLPGLLGDRSNRVLLQTNLFAVVLNRVPRNALLHQLDDILADPLDPRAVTAVLLDFHGHGHRIRAERKNVPGIPARKVHDAQRHELRTGKCARLPIGIEESRILHRQPQRHVVTK